MGTVPVGVVGWGLSLLGVRLVGSGALQGMPRPPRLELEPGIHHVFARGVNKRRIFVDDRDRIRYVEFLAEAVKKYRWRCLSYCLMDNHVHLLVETCEPTLGAGMRWLHGRYAQAFNRRHGRCGHLFGERFGAVAVATDAQLRAVAGYIARNPVAAELCADPLDWRWSSHRAVALDKTPAWLDADRLLELLGGAAGGEPCARYAECVMEADAEEAATRWRAATARHRDGGFAAALSASRRSSSGTARAA